MNRKQDQLTTVQAAAFIINYMLGAGILTLPRTTVTAAGTPDVWISIILSGLLVMLLGIILVTLCRRFPGKTVFQFTEEITGKWFAYILGVIIIAYFITISAFEIRVMADVTGLYLLEGTPVWAIVMVFMWIGFYLISGGVNSMARLYEIILPITLILFVLAIFLSSNLFEINNLRPVLGEGIMPVIKGLKPTTLAYTGYEIMFVVMAFMRNPEKGKKAMVWGILIPMGIYFITLVMVIGSLSIEGMKTRTWPTLDLMRSFEIEGLVFERFESLLLVIWIMQIFSTFTITHYAASLGCSQLFKKKQLSWMLILLPIIYIIAMLPENANDTFKLGDAVGYVSIYLFGVVPLLLLLLSMIRKKGGKYN
ncbi:spore germination protein [Paenibacillus taichungensis]|uniref:spore germination protein n=1 Tax=Paenibacillus taichungensis TaxID=484184 RepID=UPI002DBACCBF|nr:spore germination protein [Paenibacillus taichungensis]MEC0110713.1 spore germination protein [Paenibacillus taichungensis]MEC0197959.1 spore germination protein [Paenibacillus taichungensis]